MCVHLKKGKGLIMPLKTRYQYTYFIQNFIIKESKYSKYILRLLKDQRFKLKIFDKNKEIEMYTQFLPKIRNFLFKTFELEDREKQKKLEELPIETRAALIARYPSVTFEYNIKEDIQGKTIDENSIFFKIQKIGIVLFNTGIGFLYFKTNVEDSDEFSNILNFNYKFRDINQDCNNLKNYENIHVQTDTFENIKDIQDFINEITGPNVEALKIDLDIERFYTYSYVCIKQENWNQNNSFEDIKNDFLKYVNILSNDANTNSIINENAKILENSKYSKIGITKLGVNVFSSECDINNYTVFPAEFESQYFYIYILALYLKVYLKKLDYEFKKGKDVEITRKEFIHFTKELWIQEITSDDIKSLYYEYLRETLGIEKIYSDVKNKYNILYSELKIERNEKLSGFVVLVLISTLIFNIINFILYFNGK